MSSEPTLSISVNKLIELLSLEKSRLLGGSYGDIPEITQQKEFYLSALTNHMQNPGNNAALKTLQGAIEQIQSLASENEGLLSAARSGVSAAQSRLKNIVTRESFVGAYTENGQKLRTHDCGVTRCKTA